MNGDLVMDRLTIEEIENTIKEMRELMQHQHSTSSSKKCIQLGIQLLDTMRENDRLKEMLWEIANYKSIPLSEEEREQIKKEIQHKHIEESGTTAGPLISSSQVIGINKHPETICTHQWEGAKGAQDYRVRNCKKCGEAKFFDSSAPFSSAINPTKTSDNS
jgi:hypothetical protein